MGMVYKNERYYQQVEAMGIRWRCTKRKCRAYFYYTHDAKAANGKTLSTNKPTVAAVLITDNLDTKYRTQFFQVPQVLQRKPLIANKGMALLHSHYRKPAPILNSGKRFPASIGKYQDKAASRMRRKCCPKHILKAKLAARRRQQLKLHVCAASSHSSGCVDFSDTETVRSAMQEPAKKSSVDVLKSKVTARHTPYLKPNIPVATSVSAANSMNRSTNTENLRNAMQERTKKSSADMLKSKVTRHTPYPRPNVPVATSTSTTISNMNPKTNTEKVKNMVKERARKSSADMLKSKVTARTTPYPRQNVPVATSTSTVISSMNRNTNTENVSSSIQESAKKSSVDMLKSKCSVRHTPYPKPSVPAATSVSTSISSMNPNTNTGGNRKRGMQFSSAHVLQTKITARRKPSVKPNVAHIPTTNSANLSANTTQSKGCTSSKHATHHEEPSTRGPVSTDQTIDNNEPVITTRNLPSVFITSNVNLTSNSQRNATNYNLSMQSVQTQISQANTHAMKTETPSHHMQYMKPEVGSATTLSSMNIKTPIDAASDAQYGTIAQEQQFLKKETSQIVSSMLTPDTFDSDLSTCSIDTVSTAGLKTIQHDTQSVGNPLSAALTSDSVDPVLTACNLPAVLITTGDDNLPNIQYAEFDTIPHNRNIDLHPQVSQNVTHEVRSEGITATARVSLKPNGDVAHTITNSVELPISTGCGTPQYNRGMVYQETQNSHCVTSDVNLKPSLLHEEYRKSDMNVTLNTDNVKLSAATQGSMFQYNHDIPCLQDQYLKGITHDPKLEISLHHAQYFKPDIGIAHISTSDSLNPTNNPECNIYTNSGTAQYNRDMPSLEAEFSQDVTNDLNPLETREGICLKSNVDVAHTLTEPDGGTLEYNRDMPSLEAEFLQNVTYDLKSVEIPDMTSRKPSNDVTHNLNVECTSTQYNYDLPSLHAQVSQDLTHDLNREIYIKTDANCPNNSKASSLRISANNECETTQYNAEMPCLEVQFAEGISHAVDLKTSSDYAEYFKPDANFVHISNSGTLNLTNNTECTGPRNMPSLEDQFSLDVTQDLKTDLPLHQPQYFNSNLNVADTPATGSLSYPIDNAFIGPNYTSEMTSLAAQFSQNVTPSLKPAISLQSAEYFKPNVSLASAPTSECAKPQFDHNTPPQQLHDLQDATHLKSDISLHDLLDFKPDGNTSQASNNESLELFTNIDCSTSQFNHDIPCLQSEDARNVKYEVKEEIPVLHAEYLKPDTSIDSSIATGSLSSPIDGDDSNPQYNRDSATLAEQFAQNVTHNTNTDKMTLHQSRYFKSNVSVSYISPISSPKSTSDTECSTSQFNSNMLSLEPQVSEGGTYDLKSKISLQHERYLKLNVNVDQMSNFTKLSITTEDTDGNEPHVNHDMMCLQTQDSETVTCDLNSKISLHEVQYQKSDASVTHLQSSDSLSDPTVDPHDTTHNLKPAISNNQDEYIKPNYNVANIPNTTSPNHSTDAEFSTPQCDINTPSLQEQTSQDVTDDLEAEISLSGIEDRKSTTSIDTTETAIKLELTYNTVGSVAMRNHSIPNGNVLDTKDEISALITNPATPYDMQYSPITPVIDSESEDLNDADTCAIATQNSEQGENSSIPASSNNNFDSLLNDCNMSVDTDMTNLIPNAVTCDSFCPQDEMVEIETELPKENVSIPSVLTLNTLDNNMHNIVDNVIAYVKADPVQEVAKCPDDVDSTIVTTEVVETITTTSTSNSSVDLSGSRMEDDYNTIKIEASPAQEAAKCPDDVDSTIVTTEVVETITSTSTSNSPVNLSGSRMNHDYNTIKIEAGPIQEAAKCPDDMDSTIVTTEVVETITTTSTSSTTTSNPPVDLKGSRMEDDYKTIIIEGSTVQDIVKNTDNVYSTIVTTVVVETMTTPSNSPMGLEDCRIQHDYNTISIDGSPVQNVAKNTDDVDSTNVTTEVVETITTASTVNPNGSTLDHDYNTISIEDNTPQCTKTAKQEAPQRMEISSQEIQQCVDIPSQEVSQGIESPLQKIVAQEIPQYTEIPTKEVPQGIEIPSQENIAQCMEKPSQHIEIPSRKIPQCMKPPTPQNKIEIHEKEEVTTEVSVISIESLHVDTKNIEAIPSVESTSKIVEADLPKSAVITPPKLLQPGSSRAMAIDQLIATCELTLSSTTLPNKEKSKRVKSAARAKDRENSMPAEEINAVITPPKLLQPGSSRAMAIDQLIATCELTLSSTTLPNKEKSKRVKSAARAKDRENSMPAEEINALQCHFSRSGRGKRMLTVNGIKYRVNNVSQGKVRWRCSSHDRYGCKAKLHTIDNKIVYFVNEHITSSLHEDLDDIEPLGIIEDEP